MTDFHALCAELADAYLRLLEHINNSTRLGYEPSDDPLLLRVRAELAKPVAEPPAVAEQPSDEEWYALVESAWDKYETVNYLGERFMYAGDFGNALEFVRRELARWGQPPAPPAERHAAPVPVPVSERLPEPNTKVLAHYFNDHGKGRTICAIWVPAGSRECTVDDSISEPVEGCWPEGWYELIENWNWEDYGWIAVNEGEVAYWQPLPKWPAHALPLPAPQGVEAEP